MKNNEQIIPIFFTVDNDYAPYAATAIASLVANASPNRRYRIMVMHQNMNAEHQRRIAALAQKGFDIRFIAMQNSIEGIVDRMSNRLRTDYFTLTIFYRLFIPAMLPEYDKGIYLDSDVVVPGDISKMYDIDLGDNLIGACCDHSIVDVPELVDYTNRGVGVGVENYVNSGVLLMNLDALRRVKLDERFLELLKAYHFDCIAPDQDYLNVLCHGKITYLPATWDAMPVEGKDPFPEPQLIHYNLFAKPWLYDHVPYDEYFWPYAKTSGYLDEILKNKRAYSDEQRASDADCMRRLAQRGSQIADAPLNFRTVFNSGSEARL